MFSSWRRPDHSSEPKFNVLVKIETSRQARSKSTQKYIFEEDGIDETSLLSPGAGTSFDRTEVTWAVDSNGGSFEQNDCSAMETPNFMKVVRKHHNTVAPSEQKFVPFLERLNLIKALNEEEPARGRSISTVSVPSSPPKLIDPKSPVGPSKTINSHAHTACNTEEQCTETSASWGTGCNGFFFTSQQLKRDTSKELPIKGSTFAIDGETLTNEEEELSCDSSNVGSAECSEVGWVRNERIDGDEEDFQLAVLCISRADGIIKLELQSSGGHCRDDTTARSLVSQRVDSCSSETKKNRREAENNREIGSAIQSGLRHPVCADTFHISKLSDAIRSHVKGEEQHSREKSDHSVVRITSLFSQINVFRSNNNSFSDNSPHKTSKSFSGSVSTKLWNLFPSFFFNVHSDDLHNNTGAQSQFETFGETEEKHRSGSINFTSSLCNTKYTTHIMLSPSDEIHVVPCQCGLFYVGMKKQLSLAFGISRVDEQDKSAPSALMSNESKPRTCLASDHFGYKSPEECNDDECVAWSEKKHFIQNNSKIEDGKSLSELKVQFAANGCHEITVLRKGADKFESKYARWDAMTIRCADHDEMDSVIEALHTSSGASIVAFSPTPREKLKKRANVVISRRPGALYNPTMCITTEELRVGYLQNERRNRLGRRGSPSNSCGASRKDKLLGPSKETPPYTSSPINELQRQRETFARRLLFSPRYKVSQDAGKTTKNWNKTDRCELCLLHFTLLSRRHHCRKCDRSCCEDCSSVLLLEGGTETRFCNRCSTEVLRKQARSFPLCRETRVRPDSTLILSFDENSSHAFPGKAHDKCNILGVGVRGKLPHWSNYLRPADRRPAVGRITIEVLEALALPGFLINGKADPYVKVTLTGFGMDMCFDMKEWLPDKQFSLTSKYCSSTVSPVWRGPGPRGGELLTLPIICTAGAVLRIEVKHFDEMTHSRGKDMVLCAANIPLSDFTNANLRTANYSGRNRSTSYTRGGNSRLSYDGFTDRWYRLQKARDFVTLAKPIEDPHLSQIVEGGTVTPQKTHESDTNNLHKTKNVGVRSIKEIGRRLRGIFTSSIGWMCTALQLDVDRQQELLNERERIHSAIHIRIKLNMSEVGDLLSHSWFPPVQPVPPVKPFEPQLLLENMIRVKNVLKPYIKMFKFVEDVVKWRRKTKICLICYTVFALHLYFITYFIYCIHIYFILFLFIRLWKTASNNLQLHKCRFGSATISMYSDEKSRNSSDSSHSDCFDEFKLHDVQLNQSNRVNRLQPEILGSTSIQHVSDCNLSESTVELHQTKNDKLSTATTNDVRRPENPPNAVESETAQLNSAVAWVAKKVLTNRGMEKVQFKLEQIWRDFSRLNSLWDGSSAMRTMGALNVTSFSLLLHLVFDKTLLWLAGTTLLYFGLSPHFIVLSRGFVGFYRGVEKVLHRRYLHELEIKKIK